jgi:hypothetical protein
MCLFGDLIRVFVSIFDVVLRVGVARTFGFWVISLKVRAGGH